METPARSRRGDPAPGLPQFAEISYNSRPAIPQQFVVVKRPTGGRWLRASRRGSMRDLNGMRAIVTGAASGIGRELALELARCGCRLELIDIDQPGLEAVAEEVAAAGASARWHMCDLTSRDEIDTTLEAILASGDDVDVLVNNAGIASYGPTHQMTTSQWDRLLDLNLRAPVYLTHQLLPVLRNRPEPGILNVCSIAGIVAGGRSCAYHVSKFGLLGFTEALRAEYGRRGMNVTALCPGPVQTALYREGISSKVNGGIPEPPGWACASAQRVAKRGIRGLRRHKRMVLVTPLAYGLYWMHRIAPWLLDLANQATKSRRSKHAARPQPAVVPSEQQTKRAA